MSDKKQTIRSDIYKAIGKSTKRSVSSGVPLPYTGGPKRGVPLPYSGGPPKRGTPLTGGQLDTLEYGANPPAKRSTLEYLPLAGVAVGGALGARSGIKRAHSLINGGNEVAAARSFTGRTALGAAAGYGAGETARAAGLRGKSKRK